MMRALVTGAGGFLGFALAQALVERGDTVRGFSRGRYAELDALGVEQVRGDLADADAVSGAVRGCDVVFHVAGKPGAWGPFREYYAANVRGTEHVLAACRAHGVPHLVYTSSPSVVSAGRDLDGVDESFPIPARHRAHYPATKAAAERLVRAADGAALRTVSLRPHLVWGPRDQSLLPRLVARRRAGKLRRIRGPAKRIDTTYVDDAVQAHLRAADVLRGEHPERVAGKAYFVSSGAPVETFAWIDRLLDAVGLPPVDRSISPGAARTAGLLCEVVYGVLRIRSEPPLTRWVADELATAHWFDITAARRDLGYEPAVDLDTGMARLRAWWRATHG